MSSTQFVTAVPLPVEPKPGQSYTADFEAEQVWAMSSYGPFKEVRVVFYDQVGRSYASNFVPVGQPRLTANGWDLELAERQSKRPRRRILPGPPRGEV